MDSLVPRIQFKHVGRSRNEARVFAEKMLKSVEKMQNKKSFLTEFPQIKEPLHSDASALSRSSALH
jgi:hypothetical protein